MSPMEYTAKNLEETQKIAGDFVKKIISSPGEEKSATVVGLYGDLGAGKTSFTQGVAQALGVLENVVSPTFVIMKKYGIEVREKREETRNSSNLQPLISSLYYLIHIDAYRIEKSSELLHLGWQEMISDPKNLILIEWPERVSDIMPEHIHINFSHVAGDGREIEIK